jgi:hypothetical protein
MKITYGTSVKISVYPTGLGCLWTEGVAGVFMIRFAMMRRPRSRKPTALEEFVGTKKRVSAFRAHLTPQAN